ncbi:polyprenyl diphosphate synthase [bacterium]|nr:polyprenyl diphosphate synthase [bacterium]
MDGNHRWSKLNNIDITMSYKKGAEKLFKIVDHCFFYHNINCVSAFALSFHNLSRPKKVILPIIKLLDFYLDEFLSNSSKYKYNIRFVGNLNFFKIDTRKKLDTINNENKYSKTLIIALNYSGSNDIISAADLMKNNKNSKMHFSDFLSTSQYPNPDILIRTGGFKRLSDFFLFQINFTELFFLNVLWPNLKNKSVDTVISKYLKIERKFGK